jgi:hypothetical protein
MTQTKKHPPRNPTPPQQLINHLFGIDSVSAELHAYSRAKLIRTYRCRHRPTFQAGEVCLGMVQGAAQGINRLVSHRFLTILMTTRSPSQRPR